MSLEPQRLRTLRTLNLGLFLAGLALVVWRFGIATGQEATRGGLRLAIVDRVTGQPVPARVEILDRNGKGWVAEDALPVGGDPRNREAPWKGTAEEALAQLSRSFTNPYTKTTQFYSAGRSRIALAPGMYRLTVSKGLEYAVAKRELDVAAGPDLEATVPLERWTDGRKTGWFGADGHLHIARPLPELDATLSKWMQAEDIGVATLLQWGDVRAFHNTLQYRHGPGSAYQDGDYILASGQENPRTHLLGHTITWGASSPINYPESYLIYRLFWEEARRQGAVAGYAHKGVAAGAMNGLSIDLPLQLLSFLEVLQFSGASYDVWYAILDTGFRLAPTGGSDYPFGLSLPGSERFYTRVEGGLTYEKWLEGVRRGRTYATNGPLLDLRVEGRDIGDELELAGPGAVTVDAVVRFDPSRDDVERLELVRNGQVVESFARAAGPAEIRARHRLEVREGAWIALRASGKKVGLALEIPSAAHSGAIYFRVAGAPDIAAQPRARALARTWAMRLEELEARLTSQVDTMGLSGWGEGVSGEYLRNSRGALLEAIRSARARFLEQAK
jgi:hypothetical protein